MGRRYRRAVAALGALGLLAAACGDTGDAGSDDDGGGASETRAVVVATTTIWADVTRNIVCGRLADEVEVVEVVPAGVDSHQYEPSLQDRGLMGDADLVVANGLDLEDGMTPTIDTVAAEGVPVFEFAEAIVDLLEFDGDDDHADDDPGGDDHGDDDHDGDDPHVWFDPVRVASALPALGGAIVDATGVDGTQVADCVTAYQAQLTAVDGAMTETFDVVDDERRKLVTTHESLGYLADRYGFEIIGTVVGGTSSVAETNPADLEELAAAVVAAGVPAIFAQVETSAADIEALAARIDGVRVVPLLTESLGEPGSSADTYATFLTSTAATIADALAT